jgi:hypothetical protein
MDGPHPRLVSFDLASIDIDRKEIIMRIVWIILNVIGWMLTIMQPLIGFFGGFIFSVVGYNTWLSTILSLWVGDAIGIYAAGAIALLLRRSEDPKRFFMRFAATAFGSLIPIGILIVLSMKLGYESDVIQDRWGSILSLLAVVAGVIGFYVPGWINIPEAD